MDGYNRIRFARGRQTVFFEPTAVPIAAGFPLRSRQLSRKGLTFPTTTTTTKTVTRIPIGTRQTFVLMRLHLRRPCVYIPLSRRARYWYTLSRVARPPPPQRLLGQSDSNLFRETRSPSGRAYPTVR